MNYSAKIAKIIEHIDKSEGIVFIYSQYINSGIVPLALALEYSGYSKYGSSLIKDTVVQKGNYIIISGNNDLSANAYSEYIKLQHSNKNGEKIKIILGSETAGEGLDFSYIREVHILDPWYHLNKIEQVIGRGIRNCSHIDLPSEKRDVTIYLYAAVKSDKPMNDNETVDLEIYRKAELKSTQMAEIEYLLKTSAVDCYLNIHGNKFGKPVDIDGSKKCNYRECDYKCEYKGPLDNASDKDLDTDTYKLYDTMISDNIYEIKRNIIKLYKKNNYYSLDDFVNIFHDESLIYYALNDIIDKQLKIINKNGNIGTIIYKNGIYVFKSKNSSHFLSINNLRKNTKKKIGSFNISRNNVLSQLSKDNKSSKTKFVVEKTIDKEIESILEDINIILEEFPKKNTILSNNTVNDATLNLNKLYVEVKLKIKLDKIVKYYIDFMDINDKEKLTKYLIYNSLLSKLTKFEETIFETLSNILYFKKDVYFEDILYNGPEKIWGYKKINKNKIEYRRLDYETNKFVLAEEEDIKQIQKSFKKKSKTMPNSANIIGYYELRPNQTIPEFKIRDKTETVSKGSQIKTGSICGNDGMKKGKIVSYINTIKGTKIFTNDTYKEWPVKIELCRYLELILRYNDITGVDSRRHFYGPEETIEHKLNEKSFV